MERLILPHVILPSIASDQGTHFSVNELHHRLIPMEFVALTMFLITPSTWLHGTMKTHLETQLHRQLGAYSL